MKKITIATGTLITLLMAVVAGFAQTHSRDDLLKQIEAKRAELEILEKRFLAPSEEDQATYAEFLSQADTGLIRLLPREKFDTAVYTDEKKTITMRGGGAYYSFVRKTHEYGQGSDISLERDHLKSGFVGGNFGILTLLGEVPLESVTLETPVAQAMATPAAEKRKSNQDRLPLKLNATYLLRSVDNSRSDVLVAFRVVRLDTDGSAVILWKLLKSFPVKDVAKNK